MAAVYHRIESSLLDDGSFEIFFHHPWPRTFRLASWRYVHQLAGVRNPLVPEETHDAVFAWFRLGRR